MHVHSHGHGHDHAQAHGVDADAPADQRERQRRVLWWALAVNGILLVAEVIGGIVSGSLALLADASHMVSDVAGLVIALVAHHLVTRPNSSRHTFGLRRAEAMGALANALLLLGATGWIVIEAVGRLADPHPVEGGLALSVASLGLVVNIVSAVALARVRGDDLNVDGAYAHMMADTLGSIGAVGSAVAVLVWGAFWVDTVASVVIALLVLVSGWRLLSATTRVLMEAAPRGLDADDVEAAIADMDGVEGVHHLHLWSVSSDLPAMSAHVVMTPGIDLHEAQERGERIRGMLLERFGVGHSTLEFECHDCEAPAPVH